MTTESLKRVAWLALPLAALVALPTVASAEDDEAEKAKRVKPRYARQAPRQAVSAEAPEAGELPEALQLEAAAEAGPSFAEQSVEASRARPGHHPRGETYDLVDDAVAAADWAADEIARTRGWKQYYRVGFHRGMSLAIADDSLGGRDYMEGVRYGRSDPDARSLGIDLGRRAAEDAAAEPAAAQVARQFRDLHREPRFDPYPHAPVFALEDTWAAPPVLYDVFVEYPVARTVRAGRRASEALHGWAWDGWRLHECRQYSQFYDPGWRDVEFAFGRWKDGDRRSAFYRRRLSHEEKQRFRTIFANEFVRRLPWYYERHLRAGFREGFRDGWGYGAFVNAEWHYRRGYSEGFDQGVTTAAATGFETAYPYAYERHYQAAFAEWSENPMPGILSVRLDDANADGIFQPGEDVLVDYELANYGGRAGTFTVVLRGREIEQPAELTVSLPARSAVRPDAPARVRIDPGTPARTRTDIDVSVAGEHHSAGLLVSYPLEFTREVDLDSDNLGGRAVVRVLTINRSRKPIEAAVTLERVEGYAIPTMQHDLGILPAGARDWAVFELDGLRPLDMVSGNLRTYLTARSGVAVQDSLTVQFPDAATDLHNRALLELLVAFARDPGVSFADVAEARDLLRRRLEADWAAAIRGRGNPYKEDFKKSGSQTALGDLVQTYLRERSVMRSRAVFEGLDSEVEALAEDLPGTHPFLRKYMKRLARKLD